VVEMLSWLKRNWFFLSIGIAMAANIVFGLHLVVDAHEQAHAQICIQRGGNASVVLNAWGLAGGYTECSIRESNESRMLNGANEAWGYQVQAIYFSFSFQSILLTCVLLGTWKAFLDIGGI